MGSFSFTDFVVNVKHLKHNIEKINSLLSCGTKLCGVVKADAYGVGVENIINVLDNTVDCYAVANIEEGIKLRGLGLAKKIIVLGNLNYDAINEYQLKKITPTVSTVLDARKLSSGVKNAMTVEFGLNTGMNRIGFSKKSEIVEAISVINKNKKITISGVFSHLATKENDIEFIYKQKKKFDSFLQVFGGINVCKHLSNSSASLFHRGLDYDMVRVGFGMYGMDKNRLGMKPVVQIETRVVNLQTVGRYASVGYDRTFKTKSRRKIAVLPIGYYDGLSRGLSNIGRVLIDGSFAPIVGRVCMDMTMVDVTDIEHVEIGSKVVVIGSDEVNQITISDHAELLNTSSYEVLARFNRSRMNVKLKNF